MSLPSSRRAALPPREALRVRCHGHEYNNLHFTISNRLQTHSAGCYRAVVNIRNVR